MGQLEQKTNHLPWVLTLTGSHAVQHPDCDAGFYDEDENDHVAYLENPPF